MMINLDDDSDVEISSESDEIEIDYYSYSESEDGSIELDYEELVSNNHIILMKFIELLRTVILDNGPYCFISKTSSFEEPKILPNMTWKTWFQSILEEDANLFHHWLTMKPFNRISRKTIETFVMIIYEKMLYVVNNEVKKSMFYSLIVKGFVELSCGFYYPIAIRFVDANGKCKEYTIAFYKRNGGNFPLNWIILLIFSIFGDLKMEDKFVAHSYDGTFIDVKCLYQINKLLRTVNLPCNLMHSNTISLNLLAEYAFDNYSFKLPKLLREFSHYFHKREQSGKFLQNFLGKKLPLCVKCNFKLTSNFLEFIINERKKIVEAVDIIINVTVIKDCYISSFEKELRDFSYIFLLYVFHYIFIRFEKAQEKIQINPFDVENCTRQLKNCINELKRMKDDKKLKNEFISKAKLEWITELNNFKLTLETEKEEELYEILIDRILIQLNIRLTNYEKFYFLDLLNFNDVDVITKVKAFDSLKESYGRYFDLDKLKNELSMLCFNNLFSRLDYVTLLDLITENLWQHSLPQTYKLLCLVGSLPITDIPCFKTEKRIQEYVEKDEFQDHTEGLPLLEIHRELLHEIASYPCWEYEIFQAYKWHPDCCVQLSLPAVVES